MSDSRYTAGGRARIVCDALADETLPRDAMRYAFELQNFFDTPYLGNGLRYAYTSVRTKKNRKLRLLSNGTILMTSDDSQTNIPNF